MNYAIIAAGEGSRLVQEGVALPKPLVNLGGEPMIKRLIDIMLRCNAESISIIVNNEMPAVRRFISELTLPVPLNLVVKSTPSSMHSFYEVSRGFGSGKFVLTTVDTVFREPDFRRYVQAFEADDTADGYMGVTSFIDDEKPLYVAVDSDATMNITAFLDSPVPGVKYVSAGIYGLTHPALEVLAHCMDTGVSRMRNYQRALVAAGLHLKAYPLSKVIDVDHASDIATAEALIS
ncbi:MAG: NTP transferase domain-containing protein [Firmicutes bacterium]|nr:NTP transferase domain-containing protein [Bacillota bacterium]MCM1400556.1 NTP transferase domain-containing protein [Bacteroides sp.]MCM1476460.1 NTP transferase domain-containing protein [Bacteroides sp.]